MNVAIIDADLIGRKKHRFPNLACMKLSAYYKNQNHIVSLKTNYENLSEYDKVFISKVFMDTKCPEKAMELSNVEYGGTGFYYDKAPPLPKDIEHIKPDYHLYNDWVSEKLSQGVKPKDLEYYNKHSIGYTTRGCFRQCEYCVNKNCTESILHSPVSEFIDNDRKYICLLDDNIYACKDWKRVFTELQSTNKPFQFKQGMDERLLTDEKCDILFNQSKWIGDYIFAFDNIKDTSVIEEKLKLIRKYSNRIPKFYTFCGFNHLKPDHYNYEFWVKDIFDTFKRIQSLMNYNCLPYIMRYKDYKKSPFRGMYVNLARWCNQPSIFKKMSFREFCVAHGENSSCYTYMNTFETNCSDIAPYYDMKWFKQKKSMKT